MRIKKPHPFEPGREYNPGERAVYRGMVIIARIIALIAVILTGVLREVYNKKHGGVFDKKDLYATISGGLIVLLLTVY